MGKKKLIYSFSFIMKLKNPTSEWWRHRTVVLFFMSFLSAPFLSLYLVETLKIERLFLLYWEKKTKPQPTVENVLLGGFSPPGFSFCLLNLAKSYVKYGEADFSNMPREQRECRGPCSGCTHRVFTELKEICTRGMLIAYVHRHYHPDKYIFIMFEYTWHMLLPL